MARRKGEYMTAMTTYTRPDAWVTLQGNIEREANAIEECGSSAVQHAWQCGRYLIEAKSLIGHGGFVAYLNSEQWGRGRQTAHTYMRIAMLNSQATGNLTLLQDAERLAASQSKGKIHEQVLEHIRENPGCTDADIAEAIDEKASSIRGSRVRLEREGKVRKVGNKKGDGTKPHSTYAAVENEEEAEQAKKKIEKTEMEERADKMAAKILSLDARTRAAVMRRVNSDRSVADSKMRKITKDQRFGDGTPKDHVKTCVVESLHRVGSALQQNGPGTNSRWVSTCSEDEKREIRVFAENLAFSAKTLSDYLSEIL